MSEPSSPTHHFDPTILAFLCNWCGYAGADLAGVSRIQYAPNVRTIRVMCSGRVDARFIFEAFLNGIDGVLVVGCHLEDCHYISGNHEALKMMRVTRKALECAEVDSKRLQFEFVSAAEGAKFANVVNGFVEALKKIGPLEIAAGGQLALNLKAARKAFEKEGLKWILGKLEEFVERGNNYGEVFTQHEIESLLENAVRESIKQNEILVTLESEGPLSVKDMAQRIMTPPSDILRYIFLLKKKGLLTMSSIKERTPFYALEANASGRL